MSFHPAAVKLTASVYIGSVLWIFGFFFEAIAYYQNRNFRAKNQKKFIQTGLLSLSRHPNYFGDALQWCAFFIFSLQTGHYWGIIGPILMMFIFLRLTIKLLEFPQTKKRPDYKEYINTTNIFFPGPKKNQ